MGCQYCGQQLPYGRRKFCSDLCAKRYHMLIWSRKQKGITEVEHCENCGRMLKWNQKRFCCEECEQRKKPMQIIDGCARLRMAIIKQAKEDDALDRFIRSPQFYQLFPELTPDQLMKRR